MTVINYVKGIITIHTTSDVNSPHIDYNDIQNLTIQETENYGATGSVQLINDLSANTRNLLSASCNLWSDGTARKLNRAMFLRIYHTSRTSGNAIGVFLITQITASDNLITLTFCDSVQYLRSVGADYVRNHTFVPPEWVNAWTYWESNGAYAYIECPTGFIPQGGSTGDIRFHKNFADEHAQRDTYHGLDASWVNSYLQVRIDDMGADMTYINKIVINNVSLTSGVQISEEHPLKADIYVTTNSGTTRAGEFVMSSHSQDTITVNLGGNPIAASGRWVEVKVLLTLAPTPSGQKALSIGMQNNVGGYTVTEYDAFDSSSRTYSNTAFTMKLTASYRTTNVVGSEYGTFTPKRFKIDTVDGNALTSEEYESNWLGKASLYYVDPTSSMAAASVFKRILDAYDFTCNVTPDTRQVNAFRCNGDIIHNYLLALADMSNGTTQFAFRSSKTVWNHIDTGKRYKNTDTSQKTIKYAKDTGTGTDFLSFNPSISLKNNPRLAVAKGTDANDKPIVVALIDPNVPIGASSTSVNGSIATEIEGALACYSNIMTNRSEDWQGEIALSGIDLAYFKTGEYVGGVPITVNDSRYGFVNYRAKVKEVKWDFANQKTTITINNYSEVYSNAILDTSKMAYSAGDMSAEASNDDMFVRQFVNIDATSMTSDGSTNDCYFYVDSGTSGHVQDAYTIDLPELNIRVVNAYFPPGNGQASSQYGVNSVKIGNRTHTIHTARRPDKQVNQSLIVNVIYRLT